MNEDTADNAVEDPSAEKVGPPLRRPSAFYHPVRYEPNRFRHWVRGLSVGFGVVLLAMTAWVLFGSGTGTSSVIVGGFTKAWMVPFLAIGALLAIVLPIASVRREQRLEVIMEEHASELEEYGLDDEALLEDFLEEQREIEKRSRDAMDAKIEAQTAQFRRERREMVAHANRRSGSKKALRGLDAPLIIQEPITPGRVVAAVVATLAGAAILYVTIVQVVFSEALVHTYKHNIGIDFVILVVGLIVGGGLISLPPSSLLRDWSVRRRFKKQLEAEPKPPMVEESIDSTAQEPSR